MICMLVLILQGSAFCWMLVMFKPRMKKLDFDLTLKLNGRRLYETRSPKCLSIKIEGILTWSKRINDISVKLGRNNAIIYKVKEFGNLTIKTKIHKAGYSYQKKSPQIYQK